MKKLFTIDDFITAFISAIGYGLSFEIPKVLGWEMWQCGILCLLVGGTLDLLSRKIVFSQAVQNNPETKKLIVIAFFFVFLVGQFIALELTGLSMHEYLFEQYLYIIIPPVLGFAFSMALRWYHVRQIRKRYGDGSKGFLYDDILNPDEIGEWKKQNKPVKGAYDKKFAVKTKNGIYIGCKENNIVMYMGIPYAKPPVRELRWKAPEPLPESDAVFEAKYFGASAIQVDHEGSILRLHRQSEDCLTLNIAIGGKPSDKKKPVLVLFHHGDFSFGGTADPLMYGDNFIGKYSDFIGVSFNYRLGIFGFIDFSEVEGGENYPDSINLGLLDQIAALQWIKENISAFGGDPDNITAIGFESGAISISLLAACEKAKGLFKRAFIFFGNPADAYETPEGARNLAKALLKETDVTSMDGLKRLSTYQLKIAAQKVRFNRAAPTLDGKLIPLDVFDVYRNGKTDGIEFIIGIASNERQIYKSFIGEENYRKYMAESMEEIFSYLDAENIQFVKTYIENLSKTMPEVEAQAEFFEQCNNLCMYLSAKQLSAAGNKVHLMYWDVKPLIENLGSGTVDVASALLGNMKISRLYGNVLDPTISEILQALLKKFMDGDELKLYNNEIKGVKPVEWRDFPEALVVSSKKFQCETIVDKLEKVKGLLNLVESVYAITRRHKYTKENVNEKQHSRFGCFRQNLYF